MGVDLGFAKKELENLENLYSELEDVHELFDNEHISQLRLSIDSLKRHIEQNEEEDRVLRIGIVGDVKAGKSSFLNACIFNGKALLPKAATPMTAALTRISYNEADNSEAVIHFYPKKDWEEIKANADEYDRELERKYQERLQHLEEAEKKGGKAAGRAAKAALPKLSREEFEKQIRSKMSEKLCVAKELVGMACSAEAEKKLGSAEKIVVDAGTLSAGLQEYIGAHGKYTPIVSYVELKIHDPALQGVEIVDTPGLNDPIVSRCEVTKKFLGECNVAILLSPCSHFMDASTVNLMLRRLPSNNVAAIKVVGSQVDYGMMDYLGKKGYDLSDAYNTTVDNCKSRLAASLADAKRSRAPSAALASLENGEPLFSSAMCYSIAVKLKQGAALSSEERTCLENLRRFDGFRDDYLLDISGVGEIKEYFDKIREDRARLLEEDGKTFLHTCANNISCCLEDIRVCAGERRNTLEKYNIGELRKKHEGLRRILDSSRKRIKEKFDIAALDAEKNGRNIKTDIVLVQENYKDITIDKTTKEDVTIHSTGFLGLKKEAVTTHTTIRSASTSEVIQNIQFYVAACVEKVNHHFDSGLVNEERLKTDLKNIAIDSIGQNENFSVDDILSPVNVVLSRIRIPHVDVADVNQYCDAVNNHFPSGYATGNEIHALATLQQTLFAQIAEEINGKVEKTIADIVDIMKKNAASFADEVEEKLSGGFAEIEKQLEEKDRYLKKYGEFIVKIGEYKKRLRGI